MLSFHGKRWEKGHNCTEAPCAQAIRESLRYGLFRKDLLELLAEQRGFQAFLAQCITAYSYCFCVEMRGGGVPRLRVADLLDAEHQQRCGALAADQLPRGPGRNRSRSPPCQWPPRQREP